MSLPNLVRWGAGAGLLGAALSLAEGLLILANPGYWRFDSPLDYLVAAVEGVALLAVLGGLAGLHARQAGVYGRLGALGFFAAFSGTVLAGVGHLGGVPFFEFVNVGAVAYVLIGLWLGSFLIGGVTYVLGILAMSAGLLLIGVATARAGGLPRWSGLTLIAGTVGLWVAGNAGGWFMFGAAWALVGYTLLTAKGAQAD
ncbi:MAG: hypothetical protein M3N45_08855 [Actinomycetota bacterium]|nr:hypothetical protein [Actinomycetota bacterium]